MSSNRTKLSNNYKKLAMLPIVTAIIAACSTAGGEKQPQPAPVEAVPVTMAPVVETKVAANPNPVRIRAGAPTRYVVKKGDTLWDISKKFLQEPWRWPEVWYFNPQIKNPHLIYPNDVLMLSYNERGEPVIGLEGEAYNPYPNGKLINGVMKLSPYARGSGGGEPIPAINMENARQFMNSARVLAAADFDNAPRVVSSLDQHLIAGEGVEIYALGLGDNNQDNYQVVRKGRVLKDPETGAILGYEAREVARAKVALRSNDPKRPSTLQLIDGPNEVIKGDYLMSIDGSSSLNFMPRTPDHELKARVVASHNGSKNVGNNQVVIINVGASSAIKQGDVVSFSRKGPIEKLRSEKGSRYDQNIQLPDVRSGLGIVFRVFDKVSYALVVDAERQISAGDIVTTPHAGVDY